MFEFKVCFLLLLAFRNLTSERNDPHDGNLKMASISWALEADYRTGQARELIENYITRGDLCNVHDWVLESHTLTGDDSDFQVDLGTSRGHMNRLMSDEMLWFMNWSNGMTFSNVRSKHVDANGRDNVSAYPCVLQIHGANPGIAVCDPSIHPSDSKSCPDNDVIGCVETLLPGPYPFRCSSQYPTVGVETGILKCLSST